MDALKCPVCGKKEWGHVCAKRNQAATPAKSRKPERASSDAGSDDPKKPPNIGRAGGVSRKRKSSRQLLAEPVPVVGSNEPRAGEAPVGKPEPAKGKRAQRGTFDRAAYQRELMRKRRAAEKAKGEPERE